MDVLILTEAGARTGYGHLTRCGAIADAIKRNFPLARVFFLIQGDAQAAIYAKSLKLHFRMTNWFGAGMRNCLIRAATAHSVLVDSYLAPESFCRKLAAQNRRLVWLDDYGRLFYQGGTVVVPAPYLPTRFKKKTSAQKIKFGKNYIILRHAFGGTVARHVVRPVLKNVLILLGGTGTLAQVRLIMEAIPQQSKLRFSWVAPDRYPLQIPSNLRVYRRLSDRQMMQLMRRNDLAITAGGQTVYELARMGLPLIMLQLAENQQGNINFMMKTKCGFSAGDICRASVAQNIKKKWGLVQNYSVRQQMSRRSENVADGQGAVRIARLLAVNK